MIPPAISDRHLLRARRGLPASTNAVGAQAAQAAGGFLVQVLASRELGADGFATFAFLYGAMIMATALTSGLIGDSLTVLNRHDPEIRSALLSLMVPTVLLSGAAVYAVAAVAGMEQTSALLAGAATCAYMLADLARRVLMACLLFWRLVIIDVCGFGTAAGVIMILTTHSAGIGGFLVAILVWQVVVILLAVRSFPYAERAWPPWCRGDLASVMRFGVWRALQQFVRPTMLNASRWIILLVASQAAVGQLEAARVYVAPALLLVQGIGSYLLASYAADDAGPTHDLLRRADRAAVGLLISSAAVAALAAASAPVLGPLLTAGEYDLSAVAVLGWAVYAASCAAILPYGTLAAVRRRQAAVLGIRVADSLVSLSVVVVAVQTTDISASWTPMLLSVGSFIGGVVCRTALLRPLVRAERIAAVRESERT